MPELPEVETVKNVLKTFIIGKTIREIETLRRSAIQGDPLLFSSSLQGETFLDVTRIGKYLIFHLTHDKAFISHLRMEGKYYQMSEQENNSRYARVVFHFTNGQKVCYDDSRTFGKMILTNEKDYMKVKDIAKLGPEPFRLNDVMDLMKKVKNKSLPIKSALLDQTLLSGLGNIYVDETLYASKVHPWTPAKDVTVEEWNAIILNAKKILNKAIEMGGSTIKSYHPGKGIDGSFQTAIQIYGKKGETCPRCGHVFRYVKTGGRGTTFCPGCQVKKGHPIFVGITGTTGSGKSTALQMFKENKIKAISADEIVKKLYQRSDVASKVSKVLKVTFKTKKVDKAVVRDHLLLHPEDVKKINHLIHPMVGKEIETFLERNKNRGIVVSEVPLLFESGLDELFDTIIVTDVSDEVQDSRLACRDGNKAMALKEINHYSVARKRKKEAAYVLYNNGSFDEFKNEVQEVINKLKANLS